VQDLQNLTPGKALQGIPPEKLEAALDAASAEADGYLAARKVLPLTSWGADLKLHVCAMATWHAMRGRGFSTQEGANEVVRMGYQDAVAWLTKVSSGTVQLPEPIYLDSSASVAAASGEGGLRAIAVTMHVEPYTGQVRVGSPKPRGW
jgi:phage gp36-like protein